MITFPRILTTCASLLLLFCLALGQTTSTTQTPGAGSNPVIGRWEGVSKGAAIGELNITMELKEEGGKITGTIVAAQGNLPLTNGRFADGKLTIDFTTPDNLTGKIVGAVKDNKMVGEWSLGADISGTFECTRVGGTAAASGPGAPGGSTAPAGSGASLADVITGDWDAVVSSPNFGDIQLTMQLKLEGDKVSGVVNAPQGSAPITKGSWADNKLTITVEVPNGAVNFTATMREGTLTGDFDFAGQATGTWKATKKAAVK